jgi:hypothetical protein
MARRREQLTPEELERLTADEIAELDALLAAGGDEPWTPLEGPQTLAYESEADVVGYGGAAGGGKTDLAIGLSLTQHRKVAIFRQTGTELPAIVDRLAEVLGTRDGWDRYGILRTKRHDGVDVQIELGSFPNLGDESKYRGRPHDLLVFDEAAEMRRLAVLFLMGWNRTTIPGQRCRVLMCFNPPTSVEGRWVIDYFAPWLDKKHPNPAKPGELRWFVTVDGVEKEVDGPKPFQHGDELLQPSSRTFIPSRITDNPHLLGTGYMRTLMSMPEPLRSQLLYGDFHSGVEDDPFQVIPTRWVEVAMERWKKPDRLAPMDSLGVDVAMGGRDNTIIARRHGMWFDDPIVYRGDQCPDGPTIAGYITSAKRDGAVVHIDLFGVGAQPYGHLMATQQQVIGCNVGEPARGVADDGELQFKNWRSELWWRMREALDPAKNTGICLPPNKALLADLCTPKWRLNGQHIQVESREDIIKKLGRSPDYGSAYVLALLDTPKRKHARALLAGKPREYDPYRNL